jgi:hypothetical protein
MNEATIKITGVELSFLPVQTFLITLLSLKWPEVYQEIRKRICADSPLYSSSQRRKINRCLTDLFIKMIKECLGNRYCHRDITDQKKNETELIEAKVFRTRHRNCRRRK